MRLEFVRYIRRKMCIIFKVIKFNTKLKKIEKVRVLKFTEILLGFLRSFFYIFFKFKSKIIFVTFLNIF